MEYLGQILDDKDLVTKEYVDTADAGKQNTLVSGTNIKTVNNQSLLGSGNIIIQSGGGGTQTRWYGDTVSASGTATKIVTTLDGDFTLSHGNVIDVYFSYSITALSALNVDGTGQISVSNTMLALPIAANTIISFVYDANDNYFYPISVLKNATTTYYGLTKLNSATNSNLTTQAATPSAVKAAYDLADSKVSDVEVNGSSVVTNGVAEVSVPTATSDLSNDSGFIDGSSLATVATSGDYSDLTGAPTLAPVATSGDYSDLTGTPTLSPMFKTVTVTASSATSISANSYKNIALAPANQSGYTRVGLVGWNTQSTHVFIATCTSTTLTFCNKSSSAQSITPSAVWLFIRSTF